ncbi:MAG: hypothetical protein R2850_08670 [Bacteroidia bacterium]
MRFSSGIFTGKTAIYIAAFLMIAVSSNLNWPEKYSQGIIRSDAKGYYAYLPALFIYNDLHFDFFAEMDGNKYYNPYYFYDYRAAHFGHPINKYYCGTALLEMPFFLMAHTITLVSGGDADGYSYWYRIFVSIAAIFYLIAGLIFCNKLLELNEVENINRFITLISIVFGTNLFYYAIVEPGMSHIYSFAGVAMFLFYCQKYFAENNPKNLILAAIAFGIILLIRPVNGLIILALPFIAGSFDVLKNFLTAVRKKPLVLLVVALIPFLILSIQVIYYLMATGDYWVYSYGDEKFNFSSPHFFEILFSFRKGLFLYTPIYLVSLVGLFYYWKNSRFRAVSFLLFFFLLTFILSSWWNWYYGGSFSSRVYVEYLPLFIIMLGYALQKLKGPVLKPVFIGILTLLIILCQFQIYQYRYGRIHWENMNKELYLKSFKF